MGKMLILKADSDSFLTSTINIKAPRDGGTTKLELGCKVMKVMTKKKGPKTGS